MNGNGHKMVRANDAGVGVVRQGFGESSIERLGETASTMLAAQAQAEVNARYIVALQRPRDVDTFRVRVLKECERPGFAGRAYYSKPQAGATGRLTGAKGRVEGLSVRFAETAIRLMGNLDQTTRTIYDDDYKRMIRVSVVDLETNAVYSRDLVIEKTVERRDPSGYVVLDQRTNSGGQVVYIVQATEDQLLTKEAAIVSKTFRTLAQRLIPPDIIEECEQAIIATVNNALAKDPDAARKQLADGFARVNVMPSDLKAYLGHDLDKCTPAEIVALRGVYVAIRDGETTWQAVMGERSAASEGAASTASPASPPAAPAQSSRVAERVAERAKARAAEEKPRDTGPSPTANADTRPPSVPPPPPSSPVTTAPTSTAADHRAQRAAREAAEREAKARGRGARDADPEPPFGSADQETPAPSPAPAIDFQAEGDLLWKELREAKDVDTIARLADSVAAYERAGAPVGMVRPIRHILDERRRMITGQP